MSQRSKNAILMAVICCLSFLTVSYALRKDRARAAEEAKALRADEELRISPSVANAPLPGCDLINKAGTKLSDKELRTGKVMLVLVTSTCQFCFEDGNFLRGRMDAARGVRFYGVISFGTPSDLLTAEHKFPFELYFDKGGVLREALGINGVPIKLYLEDGVVKKVWKGSAVATGQERAFDEWLRGLS